MVDFQSLRASLLSGAHALVTEVEADPSKFANQITQAVGAVKTASDFLVKLQGGDAAGARAVLTSWDDVDATKLAAANVEAENEKSETLAKIVTVLQTVGSVIEFGMTVAGLVGVI